MRTSQYLLATEKEHPADAQLVSHKLMLRAGLIRQEAAGIYTWLPTGWRVLRKVERIVREEMDRAGAVELNMPCLIKAELWKESNRWDKYGSELLRITDRHQREFCFGPTHEEVITDIARKTIRSYKQLPLNLYQIKTKFRDEIRPRFGVMRGREFIMKDAYSFHLSQACLQTTYDKMYDAYMNICQRLGLEVRAVLADSGAIGGERSHEFQALATAGEDMIFYSDDSDYAANIEKASALPPQHPCPQPEQTLTLFDTPNIKTIVALQRTFEIPIQKSLKTIIVKNSKQEFFALLLRGDHQLNEIKAQNLAVMGGHCSLAKADEIQLIFGAGPGSLGPVQCPIPIIVDHDASVVADFVCGANQEGKHYKGVNWNRDVPNYGVADLRNVVVGDKSPDGQGTLQATRGIEVGHIFQLGDVYAVPMQASAPDASGQAKTLIMGCYGFGVSRVIAAAIEQQHDDHGIIWPEAIAPFQVALVPIQYHKSAQVKKITDKLYQQLLEHDIEVLLDDREDRPGVLFADMDLIGIPHRLVVSERGLKQQTVEYKARSAETSSNIPSATVVQHLLNQLASSASSPKRNMSI